MKPKPATNMSRRGTSLLELMIATSIMATLMASVVVMVRSSQSAWAAHRDETARAESAYALLRHVVRSVRQAIEVRSLTGPTDDAGKLTLAMPGGAELTYETSGTDVIYQSTDYVANSLLADNITGVTFVGYQADGVTATMDLSEIQAIECIVTFDPVSGSPRTLRGTTWLRSW